MVYFPLKVVLILANSADPDGMQHMLHFTWIFIVCQSTCYMIRLFAYCKDRIFDIHIWAWFGYFICWVKEIRFYLYFGEVFISFFGRVNVRPFHEKPNCIHTELTLINL